MKISKKQISMLVFVPLAAIFLSGCGKQPSQTTPPNADFGPTPNPALQNPEQPQDQTNASDANSASTQLEPLPSDDKQAIDTELSNIDKDIKSTDGAIKSTDLSNVNLGL